MKSIATALFDRLEAHGVELIFGIPGVHTAELYRALSSSKINHITPRHEQAAGFMADGYARITGKPGVCLVITGPGLSNIATPMLQARADSIPMLVVSTVNKSDVQSNGALHNMPNQTEFAKNVALRSVTVDSPANLEVAIDAAFEDFSDSKPGPIHIQIPLSLIRGRPGDQQTVSKTDLRAEQTNPNLTAAADLLNRCKRPVILAGGGARNAQQEVLQLAHRLNCPIVSTINARALFSLDHVNHLAASASLAAVRKLIEDADTVLAIGTELGATDYDMYETGVMPEIKHLIHIDVDESVNQAAEIPLLGRAEVILSMLLPLCDPPHQNRSLDVRQIYQSALAELSPDYQRHIRFLEAVRDGQPECIFVGDSTQLVYAGNLAFAPGQQADWFNSSCGFGTLGYGLPAAIGAKLAAPDRPVLAIVGDVGLQFVLAELGTLRDCELPITVLVWNNNGSGEIREFMQQNQIEPDGVDLVAPDFAAVANAYSIQYVAVHDYQSLSDVTINALGSSQSTLIEFKVL